MGNVSLFIVSAATLDKKKKKTNMSISGSKEIYLHELCSDSICNPHNRPWEVDS